ncbi:F-box/kelch-repeat protein At3g24760 [Physcomitrium patens]|uniref:F-box domain-containing protein n=1 Tax=Physcomitrium patens TaxID=3218 RepID=A9RV07_PHYPA|nr:F-box/kelch-repeat protein At3g24760-like [Physcomitrium patens]XP_024368457.1 F-box/kelch-repeat protein At3g24760-like [Physcomitrium patens]PNR59874.1 hypothetical protein PHYPA_002666 [Physcomitrium patens]|eukprot:XP_024368456.1 F-box/kelch-repeat protein At3g24760-like [Physcomitrella patens]
MDSFTDDLSSPLPKQMHASAPEMMEGVIMRRSSLPTNEAFDAAKRSEVEGRSVMLRPISERSGRITLKRIPVVPAMAKQEQNPSAEDLWGHLSDDILEYTLARLPLFSIKTCRKVCKRWDVVINTPRFGILHKQLGEQQPWLVYYVINNLVSSKSHAITYDEGLNTWITLPLLRIPSHNHGSLAGASGLVYAIAGLGEDRLKYKLTISTSSPSAFVDEWYETPQMEFPRGSPVVGVALGTGKTGSGHKVVVAGGTPEFEDEHMAVEVFDSETDAWETYDDLPEDFNGSSSRSWMSGVVCRNKFYVSLIHSWTIHALDLCTREWAPMHWECPQGLQYHHIMAIGKTVVVVGLYQDAEHPEEHTVAIWKVNSKTQRLIQVGSMPLELFALLGDGCTDPTLNFLMSDNLLYISNTYSPDRAVVVGDISLEDHKTFWRTLPSISNLGCRFDKVVTFCSSINTDPSSPAPH